EARRGAGMAKQTDVNVAQLAVLRAEQAIREAQDSRDRIQRTLSAVTGLDGPFAITIGDLSAPASGQDALVTHALPSRPELAAANARIRAAKADRQAANAGWSPSLSAFGQARRSNYAESDGDH